MHAKYTHRGSHNRRPNHQAQEPKYRESSEYANKQKQLIELRTVTQ